MDKTYLHIQIKESLLGGIRQNNFPAGSKLPSQRELCEMYHASLMTIRKVLDELHHDGVIRSIPTKGIYVSTQPQTADFGSLLGFKDQLQRMGLSGYTKDLEAKEIAANPQTAHMLRVPVNTHLVYLHRLRVVDEKPFSIYKVYLPSHLVPGLLDEPFIHGSLYETLREKYHHQLVGSRNFVSAVMSDDEETQKLGLSEPSVLLLKEQVTFIDSGEAIEYSRNCTRGELYCVQYDEGKVSD